MDPTTWVLPVGLPLIGLLCSVAFAAFGSRLAGTTRRRGAGWGVLAWLLMVPWFEFYLAWNVRLEQFGRVSAGGGGVLAVTHGVFGGVVERR